jgi:hypothetical protein
MQIAELVAVNKRTIQLAGPRYTPGVDPSAPNIEIRELIEAFDALAFAPGYQQRLNELIRALDKASRDGRFTLNKLFRKHLITPTTVMADLRVLEAASDPNGLREPLRQVRRSSHSLSRVLDRAQTRFYEQMSRIRTEDSDRSARERIDSDLRHIRGLNSALSEITAFLDLTPGRPLGDVSRLLLLGEWGTGKTHFLCDTARRATGEGTPALVVLASTLEASLDPIDAVAKFTGLAADGRQLLDQLETLGRRVRRRALLMIDAINEGDRDTWQQRIAAVARRMGGYPHVGLVLSCRSPFDRAILTSDRQRRLFMALHHPGFTEQEFDAQLEYFTHYGIAPPHVPLLTPEFSRPLFLKLLCISLCDMSTTGKHKQLRDIASGQKGMTFVMERFAAAIGKVIESDFGLGSKQCWRVLKGTNGHPGIAGTMASFGRDFLTRPEAASSIADATPCSQDVADRLLKRMLSDGLLAEEMRYHEDDVIEAVTFPYQRFGDHLIARHLLDSNLSPTGATEQSIRRLFYAGRPLGQPFEMEGGNSRFKAPGLAAALMLEFPERMRRTKLPREVLHYLPRSRRYVAPIKEAFLEGLYWRSSSSFSAETDSMVGYLLKIDDHWIRDEVLEVLATLATRAQHPYDAGRLYAHLEQLTMSERDVYWSEFLRRRDKESVVYRLLAWIERTLGLQRPTTEVNNELQFLSLLLTTTERVLRDRATRAIVWLGLRHPVELFAGCLRSFKFNDPYVSERMLAAAYGVAMRQWSAPDGGRLRASIVSFARQLVRLMFLPGAPHATTHTLARDYALGVIELARRGDRHAIAPRYVHHLTAPNRATGQGFPPASQIDNAAAEAVKDVLHMDFENYTIGRLVPERGNYQMEHPEYQEVRKQILWRVTDLGYTTAAFGQIDQTINRYAWNRQDGNRTDRYGKKYSWIAFYEMYGIRADLGLLDPHRIIERCSDCDLDPSFPEPAPEWSAPVPDVFTGGPNLPAEWLRSGPVPNYDSLTEMDDIDGIQGPWVLLDGFFLQRSGEREVFTFMRGLLLRSTVIGMLRHGVQETRYLGNDKIPEGGSDYYTYAGEIPWSQRFGTQENEQGRPVRRRFSKALSWHNGISVEVPVWKWTWESFHSSLNQADNTEVPSPHLCDHLSLRGRHGSFDMFDEGGRPASLYREWPKDTNAFSRSHALYLRRDLVLRYLEHTGQHLVWVPWGERRVYRPDHDIDRSPDVVEAMQAYDHTFGSVLLWSGTSQPDGPVDAAA